VKQCMVICGARDSATGGFSPGNAKRLTRHFHACVYACTCIAQYVASILFHRHPRLALVLATDQVDLPHIASRRSYLGFGFTMASLHKHATGCRLHRAKCKLGLART
jgi:hypothetical protein